ncbi:MAG TPA: hypothetical protein VGF22_07495, partial [Acidimicrobiales bacterium]
MSTALAAVTLAAAPRAASAAPSTGPRVNIGGAFGVALDVARNRLYVTTNTGTIRALDATTLDLLAIGGTVSSPTGLDVDQVTGNIYIA